MEHPSLRFVSLVREHLLRLARDSFGDERKSYRRHGSTVRHEHDCDLYHVVCDYSPGFGKRSR